MKNKRITDSWNRINPDEESEKRMLEEILKRSHAESTFVSDASGSTETESPAETRSEKKAGRILLTALSAAACFAVLIGTGTILHNFSSASKNDNTTVLTTDTYSSEYVTETSGPEAAITYPVTFPESFSDVIKTTDPILSGSSVSEIISTIADTGKSTQPVSSDIHTDISGKGEAKDPVIINTEPSAAELEKPDIKDTHKTAETSSPVISVSTPEKTVITTPAVTEEPVQLKKMTLEDVIELSGKGNYIEWDDLTGFSCEPVFSGRFVLRYELEDYSAFSFWIEYQDSDYPSMALLVFNLSSLKSIDIRTNSEEQIRDFVNSNIRNTPVENISDVIIPGFSTN